MPKGVEIRMKRVKEWFRVQSLNLFSIVALSLAVILLILGLVAMDDRNTKLEKKISSLEKEVEDKQNIIFERNNELYLCKMEKDEWKELFYSEIDFHSYEGPDW